jgi:hypothetical protein
MKQGFLMVAIFTVVFGPDEITLGGAPEFPSAPALP